MGNLKKQLPLGFRFQPTDLELIRDYLIKKLRNQQLCSNAVVEGNVYSTEPWNLKGNKDDNIGGEIDKGYYFVNREKKSSNSKGVRTNRSANPRHGRGGFWRASGGDKKIHDKRNNLVGVKKSLKFFRYTNDKKTTKEGEKTGWIMHEYTLPHSKNEFQSWVLCSIRFNGDDAEYQQQMEDKKIEQQEAPDHHRHVEPAVILQQEHQEVHLHDQKEQQQQQQPLIPLSWPAQDQDFKLGDNKKMMQLDLAGGGLLTPLFADEKDFLFGLSNKMEDAVASAMYPPGACSTNHNQIVDVAAAKRRCLISDNNAHDQHGLMKKLRNCGR